MILVKRYAENYDSCGVTDNNIISYQHNTTFYQEISLHYYEKNHAKKL